MSSCLTKRAGERIRHRVVFEAPLLGEGETVAGNEEWLVQRVNPEPLPAKVVDLQHDNFSTEASIEGGAPGEAYLVTAQAQTNLGRLVKRSFVLRIAP